MPCAEYTHPTEDYRHCVLGDCTEYRGLRVHIPDEDVAGDPMTGLDYKTFDLILPPDRVFEDLYPRCLHNTVPAFVDGPPMYLVVESSVTLGGSLALYTVKHGALVKWAATPHIGQRNRWLAPVGAGDLDGDGKIEFAYVDRPHLAQTLRIVRRDGDRLRQVASVVGVTNHRIGEDFITGGIRDCGDTKEMLTVDPAWRRIVASRLVDGRVESRDIGPFRGQASMQRALRCR